jgi:hypothetical protein
MKSNRRPQGLQLRRIVSCRASGWGGIVGRRRRVVSAGRILTVGRAYPHISFHIPTLPPPFLPAGASALVDFVVRCIFLYLVFCFSLLLFFLATFCFSTEDSFIRVFEPSWSAIPFHWPRSAPHNPVFVRADHPFAFFSSLFAQTFPQENCRPLLITPEPGLASACIVEEGRRRNRRLSL